MNKLLSMLLVLILLISLSACGAEPAAPAAESPAQDIPAAEEPPEATPEEPEEELTTEEKILQEFTSYAENSTYTAAAALSDSVRLATKTTSSYDGQENDPESLAVWISHSGDSYSLITEEYHWSSLYLWYRTNADKDVYFANSFSDGLAVPAANEIPDYRNFMETVFKQGYSSAVRIPDYDYDMAVSVDPDGYSGILCSLSDGAPVSYYTLPYNIAELEITREETDKEIQYSYSTQYEYPEYNYISSTDTVVTVNREYGLVVSVLTDSKGTSNGTENNSKTEFALNLDCEGFEDSSEAILDAFHNFKDYKSRNRDGYADLSADMPLELNAQTNKGEAITMKSFPDAKVILFVYFNQHMQQSLTAICDELQQLCDRYNDLGLAIVLRPYFSGGMETNPGDYSFPVISSKIYYGGNYNFDNISNTLNSDLLFLYDAESGNTVCRIAEGITDYDFSCLKENIEQLLG